MAKTSRDEIVAVARDLIRDKGFAGTSMRDIADRVGLLKGSLYSHFPSKDSLVPEVLDLVVNETFGDLVPTGDWRGDYERVLGRLVELLRGNGKCIGLHLAYGLEGSDTARRADVRSFFGRLEALLRTMLEQGLDADVARTFARLTITMTEGATLWLALDGDPAPQDEARRFLVETADGYAEPIEEKEARAILDRDMGDWRRAGRTERRLAARLAATEAELRTRRVAP